MSETVQIRVQVAYALPHKQRVIDIEVSEGCTAREAVEQSRISEQFPDLDLSNAKFGIFGKSVKADQVLVDGDRVEIYRKLIADPKESRKKRADRAKAKRETD